MEYKYTLKIDGMMCGMCEAHVNNVIRRNFQIKKVSSSHSKNQTTIITESLLDEELLKNKICETGYKVLGIKYEEEIKKKGLFTKLFKK